MVLNPVTLLVAPAVAKEIQTRGDHRETSYSIVVQKKQANIMITKLSHQKP